MSNQVESTQTKQELIKEIEEQLLCLIYNWEQDSEVRIKKITLVEGMFEGEKITSAVKVDLK